MTAVLDSVGVEPPIFVDSDGFVCEEGMGFH